MPPLQLQLMSFSYDRGQPHETLANLNARVLPNPGKAAKGRTGLDRRIAKEVLAAPGASHWPAPAAAFTPRSAGVPLSVQWAPSSYTTLQRRIRLRMSTSG